MAKFVNENFIKVEIAPPNPVSDVKNWDDPNFGIRVFNHKVLSVSKDYRKKPLAAGLELVITKPFVLELNDVYVNYRAMVFGRNKKLIKESLNSYYEFDDVLFLEVSKYAKVVLKFAKVFRRIFGDKNLHILRKKFAMRFFSNEEFNKSEILELDDNYKYIVFFDYYYSNFTHFMVEAYPRLYSYYTKLTAEEKGNIKVIVPPKMIEHEAAYNAWEFIAPCLSALNIHEDQRVYLEKDMMFHIKSLVLPSQTKLHPSIVNSTKSLINHFCSGVNEYSGYDKVYISKRKSVRRNIVNSDQCLAKLVSLGFKEVVMEDISFIDKIKVMQAAKVIVTTDSSSFTNIIFSKPGTKVLVLTFDSMPIYTLLTSSIYNMDVCYQICEPENRDEFFWYSSNMIVDLDKLENKLRSWRAI